jgi:hypothetical protein
VSNLRVFADTNTLYPFYVCDLVLHCAEEDLFEFLWTEELLIDQMPGSDPDDHVHSAAAIAGNANILLTRDRAGFPRTPLRRHGLRVTTVDQFLCEQFTLFPDDLIRVLNNQVSDLTKSRLTRDELLNCLSHHSGAPRFARQVRQYLRPTGGQGPGVG